MNKQQLIKATVFAGVASLGLLLSASVALADGVAGEKGAKVATVGLMGPAPKAVCGPFDWTESGLQGQTTAWERLSGDSEGGYNCNLELVGQFRGEGGLLTERACVL